MEVKAPMCVHATLMRQRRDGSERLIVHLYNDINTTAFHALPASDVPLREETRRAGMPSGDEDFYQAYVLLVDSVEARVLGGARFTATKPAV